MEKHLGRQYKVIFILGMIIYLGIFLIGTLPGHLYGAGFWEQNTFLRFISGIFGILWILAVAGYLHFNIFTFKPLLKLGNTVQVINIALVVFTLDIALLEEGLFSIETTMWLFLAIGLFVITSNIFVYIKYSKNKVMNNYKVVSLYDDLKVFESDLKELVFLSHMLFLGMFAVVIYQEINEIKDYIFLFLITAYFIYKYLRVMKPTMNRKIFIILQAIVLYGLVIFMFVTFNEFINQHVAIKSLLAFTPMFYIMFYIIQAFYSRMLKEFID